MASRLEGLRERLRAEGLSAALITSRPNVRYLCGFDGSSGALLVDEKEAILFTDSRYTLQARAEVAGAGVETVTGPPANAAVRAARAGARIAFESEHLSVAQHADLGGDSREVTLVPTRGVVERLRVIKDGDEIRAIEASVALTSRAFEVALGVTGEGAVEEAVAAAVEHQMRRLGASAPAFESIVASGPRGAWPHARASDNRLRAGEPVVVDIGAIVHGYASDMSRTLFVGDAGSLGRRVHAAVLEAVRRAESKVRAGVPASEVDAEARAAIVEAGFGGESFQHGTGHGVGLEVHEAPRVARGAAGVLAAGMVMTIEPGVYVPGWGGVRIEDVVVVEEAGCRVLTPTTKEIIAV